MALPGVDIEAVEEQVQRQCDALPRAEAARSALSHSCIVRVGGREEARSKPLSTFAAHLGATCWCFMRHHPHASRSICKFILTPHLPLTWQITDYRRLLFPTGMRRSI